MYELSLEYNLSSAHQIIGHKGKCKNLHGHNWRVVVSLGATVAEDLLQNQAQTKEAIASIIDAYDHKFLNELPAFAECNSTAENISRILYEEIANCLQLPIQITKLTVWETQKYSASYQV